MKVKITNYRAIVEIFFILNKQKMFPDCGLSCGLSFNSVPSSTFWLVVAILFIMILVVVDTAARNKQDSDAFVQSTNNSIRYQRQDINATFTKIAELEKKIADLSVPPVPPAPSAPPAPKKKLVKNTEEDEDEDEE
jgi:uncharacterized membrane protein